MSAHALHVLMDIRLCSYACFTITFLTFVLHTLSLLLHTNVQANAVACLCVGMQIHPFASYHGVKVVLTLFVNLASLQNSFFVATKDNARTGLERE